MIAIAANDANAVAPALKRAAKEGIHVISYDSGVATEARQVFVNQVKGESLAEMMLISMHDLIGGEGEFAILSSTATATNQNAWIDFMKAKMASDPKFAKMKLVQVAYGEESEQVNQQQALALVQAFPNLKGIIVPAGIGLPAAARALEQAGALSKVKLTGLAPATLMKKYILARRGPGHLVERHRPRLSDLSSRPAGGDVQDHRQGRREVHRRPAWRLCRRQGRRGRSGSGKDRDAAERR